MSHTSNMPEHKLRQPADAAPVAAAHLHGPNDNGPDQNNATSNPDGCKMAPSTTANVDLARDELTTHRAQTAANRRSASLLASRLEVSRVPTRVDVGASSR
jgi:hypothetical protein